MTENLASKIMASRVVSYEYISALDALKHLTEHFGWRVVIEAICQLRGVPDIWDVAERLRRVVATEFEPCVAMRADIETGCYQCSKWDGEGCMNDAVLELLDDTAFLADSPEPPLSTDGESGESET